VIERVVDTLLDRSVVGWLHPARIHGAPRWWSPLMRTLKGRVIAITGATSGIGRAAAVRFAQAEARLVLLVRDVQRGADLRAALSESTGSATIECATATRPAWIRCASVSHLSPDELPALNVVGPVLLTARLAPLLALSRAGRIITVASAGMTSRWSASRSEASSPTPARAGTGRAHRDVGRATSEEQRRLHRQTSFRATTRICRDRASDLLRAASGG
jgi:hypothetical protein